MDNQTLALHTAARRFCMDRHRIWAIRYMNLENAGKARISFRESWTYSTDAYQLFPRYRLDEAILNEVEKSTGQQYPALADARLQLVTAGHRASKALLDEFAKTREAVSSLKEEAESFQQFVQTITEDELKQIEPLPYRRVLTQEESDRLWGELKSIWSIGDAGHYWYPLTEVGRGLNVIAFHDELWDARRGRELVRRALKERNIGRCYVLRELGPPDYQVDADTLDPGYDGSESFATSDFGWLIYASHDSSITVAGWLADLCRSEWPDWPNLTYGGPFHTDDLRGTWNA